MDHVQEFQGFPDLRDHTSLALLYCLIADLLPSGKLLPELSFIYDNRTLHKYRHDAVNSQLYRFLNDRLHLGCLGYALIQRHSRFRLSCKLLFIYNSKRYTGLLNIFNLGFVFPLGSIRYRNTVSDTPPQNLRQMLDIFRLFQINMSSRNCLFLNKESAHLFSSVIFVSLILLSFVILSHALLYHVFALSS